MRAPWKCVTATWVMAAVVTAEVVQPPKLSSQELAAATVSYPSLIDINFYAHQSPALDGLKVGLAATGQSTNDFWNAYSRDDGHGNWLVNGALPNLKFADGSISGAGLIVSNAPGCWYCGSSDAMYNTYIYPFNGGNVTATLTNLPAGQYDFYVYSGDGNYQLTVGSTDYGIKTTLEVPVTNPPAWQEGRQYALFRGVSVGAGQAATLIVRPGQLGYAIISGMQIASATVVTGAPPCAPAPEGLVSWWRGEGDANDSVGSNPGTFVNGVTFAPGEVGQAFALNGTDSSVLVPASPSLSVRSFTIEGWINPSDVSSQRPIAEYSATTGWAGVHLWIAVDSPGSLFANIRAVGLPLDQNRLSTAANLVHSNQWSHVALTFDQATGDARLYVNGTLGGTRNLGAIVPSTGLPLNIGLRPSVTEWGVGTRFAGQIDELSIYRRALAASEIQAVYNSAAAGKCVGSAPATILSQPVNQTVPTGGTASFTVVAAGTPPLSYQWQFSGTNLGGATGSLLLLTNVQMIQAGNYAVQVTNAYASTISSNALLTVNPPPPCVTPLSGLVGWWAGEGNADDRVGGNNGTLVNGVGFAPGKVLQAFSFDGVRSYVNNGVPGLTNIRNSYTMEFWAWPKAARASTAETTSGLAGISNQRYAIFPNWGGPSLAGAGVSVGTNGVSVFEHGPVYMPSLLVYNASIVGWTHIAVVYVNQQPSLYLNGVLVRTGLTSKAVSYPSTCLGEAGVGYGYYAGLLDEVSIYNRALSGAEIQAICNAGGSGKCHEVPMILAQPAGATVTETSNTTFSVTAAGTPPLHCQWRFNGSNIAGATDTSLRLTNVQVSQAGLYSVCITNLFGSVISSNALLTVNRFPVAFCADAVVSAGANCQAEASINRGSFDPDGDPITVSQLPPSPYPLGTNRVTLTVADDKGASSSCSALVIVRDRTPPMLSCPGAKTLEFQNEIGAVAMYSITATDFCSTVSLVVTPPSGSLFPIGVTPVDVQAVDGFGNGAQCSFAVTVLGAQGVKSNVLAELVGPRATTNLTEPFAQKLDDAIQHLANSLNPAYWIDQTHLQRRGGNTAMNEEKLAVIALAEIMDARDCPLDPAVLLGWIDRIVRCDRLLAVISIQDAAKAGLSPKKVAEDLEMVAKGDREAAAGQYANAIEHYRNAWRHALQLRLQVSLSADGGARIQFVGNSSQSYRIEVSTDLVNWTPLGTCTADGEGNVEFTDPNAAGQPVRLYRAVEQ